MQGCSSNFIHFSSSVLETSFCHSQRLTFALHAHIYDFTDDQRRVSCFNRMAYLTCNPCQGFVENRTSIRPHFKPDASQLIRLLQR